MRVEKADRAVLHQTPSLPVSTEALLVPSTEQLPPPRRQLSLGESPKLAGESDDEHRR